MGQLNKKYRQTAAQYLEEGRRYDAIAAHNKRAQDIINLRAILKKGGTNGKI